MIRRCRYSTLQFLDSLALFLHAGVDLPSAFQRAYPPTAHPRHLPIPREESESFLQCLGRWEKEYPIASYRPWFALIAELYREGTELSDALHQFAELLRQDHQQEVEAFLRETPTRVNLVLLVFLLPVVLAVIFIPFINKLPTLAPS